MPEERYQSAGELARFNVARPPAIETTGKAQTQPLPSFSSAHQAALLDVAALRRLEANWDSYGAPTISAEALQSATLVLQLVDALQPGSGHIAPVSGGGVQISWRRGDRELELEVLPDGSALYLAAEGDTTEEGEIALDQDALRALVRWLLDQ